MISSQKNLCLGVLFCSSLILTGCQNTDKKAPQDKSRATAVAAVSPKQVSASPSAAKMTKIDLCQSELASLRQINPKAYALQKAYFARLLSNASVYSAVRGDVNAATKDTLDALYKYKTNQICAEIEREVLQSLIQRGESVK